MGALGGSTDKSMVTKGLLAYMPALWMHSASRGALTPGGSGEQQECCTGQLRGAVRIACACAGKRAPVGEILRRPHSLGFPFQADGSSRSSMAPELCRDTIESDVPVPSTPNGCDVGHEGVVADAQDCGVQAAMTGQGVGEGGVVLAPVRS
jgi:hypothetical protein